MQENKKEIGVLQVVFPSLKFVSLYDLAPSFDSASVSITSSHIITESSIILAKYFPFSQSHVAGFQTKHFSHT